MNKFIIIAIIVIIIGVFAYSSYDTYFSYSNWDTLGGNFDRQGYSSSSFIKNNLLWKKPILGNYDEYAGVAIHDNVVYASGKEMAGGSGFLKTYAIDIETGNLIWTANTGGSDDTPTYYNGKIFVQSYTNDNHLWCLDAKTGSVVWSFETPILYSSQLYSGSPAIDTNRNNVITQANGIIYSVDIDTGAEVWEVHLNAQTANTPTYYDDKIYTPYRNGFKCLDASDGSTIWSADLGGCWDAAPMFTNGKMYFGSFDYIACFNPSNGNIYWKYTLNTDRIYTTMAYDPSTGYVFAGGLNGRLYALDSNSGDLKWYYDTGGDIYSSPAVASGYIYFGSHDHYIYCLKTYSGEMVWRYQTEGRIFSQMAISSGILIIGSDDWNLYALGELS